MEVKRSLLSVVLALLGHTSVCLASPEGAHVHGKDWSVDVPKGWHVAGVSSTWTMVATDDFIGDEPVVATLSARGPGDPDAVAKELTARFVEHHGEKKIGGPLSITLYGKRGCLVIVDDRKHDRVVGQFVAFTPRGTYVMTCQGDAGHRTRVALACLDVLENVRVAK